MKEKKQLFSLFSVCIYPNLFMYFQNVKEAQIVDVFPIIILFLFTAAVVLVVILLIMRDLELSISVTNLIMLIIINFEIFSNLASSFSHKYIITIVVSGMILSAFIYFFKKKKEVVASFNQIILIVFSVLIIVNALPAIPIIIHKMYIEVNRTEVLSSINLSEVDMKEKPNIYYMIFDEYGGEKNLEKYFEYDNAEFMRSLSNQGFNVSISSRNEESLSTTTIVPNLLNLNYVVNDSIIQEERLAYMKEPELFKVIQYLGYDIVTCSFWHFLDNSMSIKNFEDEISFESKAGYFVLKNSGFIHLYEKYLEYQIFNRESNGSSIIDALRYYKELPCTNEYEKPQFSIGYFQAPHTPFYYRSDGTLNPVEEHQNWLNCDNYIEYLKWINGNIDEIVKSIIENDSNSIIVIQSDHGARYPIHVEEATGKNPYSAEDSSYQNFILNCVYYKGEKIDIEGLSGINTLRYILNEEFNTNLEMVYYDVSAK